MYETAFKQDSGSGNSSKKEITIRNKKEWQAILDGGAVVLWETRYHKVFRMPDGSLWRVLPIWRKAWPFEIDAGDPGSAGAHNSGVMGSTPIPATNNAVSREEADIPCQNTKTTQPQ